MARAYSQDLRDRVIGAALDGAAVRDVAARFGIAASTATRWVKRAKETGERKARRQGHGGCSKLDPHRDFLLTVITETPRITLSALRERLRLERGLSVGAATIWAFLKRERPGPNPKSRAKNMPPRRCKTDDGRSDNVGC